MNTITCKKCGNIIEVSQALEDQARKSIEEKVNLESRVKIEQLQKAAEESAFKKFSEKFELESRQKQIEADENRKQNKEMRDQIIALTKQLRDQKVREENLELTMQKKLLDEQDKIRQKTIEEETERNRMKEKEKDLLIDGLKKSLEDAQRKAAQGSQQSQGEVQEVDLEEMLHREFRDDEIEPIGKGVLGADIRQIVRSPKGLDCGRILWESKRTKAWSDGWIIKLKSDLLADKSHIPVIISDTLPEEAKSGIGFRSGVWVAAPKFALILSALLRKSLLDAAKQRVISAQKQTKAEELYGYVTSIDFIHQMEAMIETYREMQKEITDERTVFERIWKKREMQVTRLLSGVSGIYGSMQGIAGQALPTVKGLDLLDDTEPNSPETPKLL
jgi:hypothetical protein